MTPDTFASDFVQSLTDEIERFTTALPPTATTYRGADLRFALQRALYFDLVNDEECRRAWYAAQPEAGWLARRLARRLRTRPEVAAVLTLPRFARDALSSWRAPAAVVGAPPPARVGTLVFAVIHPKFVRYVQGIGLDRETTLFYCGTRHALRAELAASGVAVAIAPTAAPWRRLVDWRLPQLGAYGLQREFDAHLAFLAQHKPRTVVVVEGNAPSDELMNRACKLAGIPCICIQQGWSPIIHAGFRHFSFSRMLVWGDEFARLLAPYSPDQRFVATGSHVIGPAQPGSPAVPRVALSFFLQGKSPMIDDAAWDGFLELVQRVAARCPSLPILVREHPSAPLTASARATLRGFRNVEHIDPATSPLQEQLARSRVGVSLFSTTLFECAAAGVVPVAVNPGILRELIPSLDGTGVGIEARTWADAEAAIVRLGEDQPFYEKYAAQQGAFARRFFNGATREQAKTVLRGELERA